MIFCVCLEELISSKWLLSCIVTRKRGDYKVSEIGDRAKDLFRGKDKLHCAQAIFKTFQYISGMTDEDIAGYANAGGGKAPGGVCGALYAAQVLLDDDQLTFQLASQFNGSAGASTCKPIRKKKIMSCKDCVAFAAEFVEKHL